MRNEGGDTDAGAAEGDGDAFELVLLGAEPKLAVDELGALDTVGEEQRARPLGIGRAQPVIASGALE